MPTDENLPASLDEIWQLTREHLHRENAGNLDEILTDIGNRVVDRRDEPEESAEQLLYQAWKAASPETRHQLAELWIRAVGHEEFPQE